MAGTPHYKNSKAAMINSEPVYLNLFEFSITPPAGIDAGTGNNNQNLLLEHVKKISGLELDKNPATVEQFYKFAKRRYAGAKPETTTMDITVDFEVNLNDANSMYTFKTLRAWSDLIYNPLTGAMGLKRDYIGSGLITIFNRQGDIHRRVRLPVIFPISAISPMELDYNSTEVYVLSLTFAADYWEDVFL